MFDEVRDMHACFACGRAFSWVAHLFGGSLVIQGNDVVGGVSIVGAKSAANQLPLEVKVVCPQCGANNSFSHQHTAG